MQVQELAQPPVTRVMEALDQHQMIVINHMGDMLDQGTTQETGQTLDQSSTPHLGEVGQQTGELVLKDLQKKDHM